MFFTLVREGEISVKSQVKFYYHINLRKSKKELIHLKSNLKPEDQNG